MAKEKYWLFTGRPLITLKLFVLHHWVRGDTKSEVRMLDAGCWKLDGHF